MTAENPTVFPFSDFSSSPCQSLSPAGTEPACSRGVPEAIKAVNVKLS